MKIAFLNIYSGTINRGAERSTHVLANRLSNNHEIWVFQGGKVFDDAKYKTVVARPLFSKSSDSSSSFLRKIYLDIWSLNILVFSLNLLPYLLRENFDLIIPINGGWQTVLCRIVTSLRKSKMMVIGRAGIGRNDKWNLLFRPDVFVALTTRALVWAKERAKKTRIVLIPNGIDLQEFSPDGEKAKIDLAHPIILCAAAFNENKRIEETIKAVAKLKNCQLLILGDGLLAGKLQHLAEDLLGRKRYLIKSVPLSQMPTYYRAADVFTLLSDTGEAFGNVYLEAMATNLPVVATRDETRKEIVGKAGLFVKSKNIDGYASALKKAIETDFGNLPRIQAEKFSWDKIVLEYEKLFRQFK